jgi:hypothetical protein
MATKKSKQYCSIVLVNGMEYMTVIKDGWDKEGFGTEGFFTAETLDGKPILFNSSRISLLREVDEKEYKIWKDNLDAYRQEQLKKAQEENKIDNLKV